MYVLVGANSARADHSDISLQVSLKCTYLQVLSVAVLVAACVSISDVDIDTSGASSHVKDLVSDGRSAAGFMVFTSLLAMVIEGTLILIQFLNFGVVDRFFGAFLLIVSAYGLQCLTWSQAYLSTAEISM